ncbi:MAG: aspartate ammonia-lyase [Candidatus Nitrosocaldaceae archaeon]|nr:MAG: aspartate ammonia-lyase [Candidatus Nitrosocaldaceae archaeon]
MEFRVDKDSLGEVQIPKDAYYGPFTARAIKHYNVTGLRMHEKMIKAFVMIKRSAALANMELNVLDREKGEAIVKAADEILAGKLLDQFVVDAINSGAGTAFNMNTNEVIANRALEILGREKGEYSIIHPNDHVNASQSSNDTFPTAMHVAVLLNINELLPVIDNLINALREKGEEFKDIIKIGRTHLMDALPVTLGSEFNAYATAIEKARKELDASRELLEYVALGGTAVGTGANAPKGYRELAIKYLADISGLDLKPEPDMQFGLQSRFGIANASSALRNLALELIRIANDLRLMASGPKAGFAEINIPAIHAGSSIMPGKVNPSLAECLNMVCFNVIGNDHAVALANQAGQFELNVMLPSMAKAILESIDMLKGILRSFIDNMLKGITANRERLEASIEKNPILVTLLAPYIGYLKAAEIYKEALKRDASIRELVLEKGLLDEDKVNEALDIKKLFE